MLDCWSSTRKTNNKRCSRMTAQNEIEIMGYWIKSLIYLL